MELGGKFHPFHRAGWEVLPDGKGGVLGKYDIAEVCSGVCRDRLIAMYGVGWREGAGVFGVVDAGGDALGSFLRNCLLQ